MRGKLWINSFVKSLIKLEDESDVKTDTEWTGFMGKVINEVGKETNCYVAMLNKVSEEDEYSGEYLNIDAFFIDNREYENWNTEDWDPPVLPSAVVELENAYDNEKITYCLWKVLCIRAPVRVLICYQGRTDAIEKLRKHLEGVIWQGSLMKGTEGDLLVIIGDDSKGGESEWSEYFNVFEWRNDRLERIESLEW